MTAGRLADVTGDAVAVTDDKATELGLSVGDRVPFRFADGQTVDLTVKAVYATDLPMSEGSWLLDVGTYAAHGADQFDRMLFVGLDDGVDVATGRASLESALAGWPNATIEDQAEFRTAVTEEIDMMLNLMYGLLGLAVVISLMGIANTLALSIEERTRELGLLRAVGMHRRQLKRAIRAEALLISTLGAMLGAVLAIAGAWGLVSALGTEGVSEFVVPEVRIAVIVGVAALAGVLAASGPARRASRLDVLSAIAHD